MSTLKFTSLFLALGCAHANTQSPVQVNVTGAPPSGASQTINPSFVSFAVECYSFTEYTNENFSLNIFSEFSSRLNNNSLIIRLGGTSQDNSVWKPDQKQAIVYPNGNNGLTSLLYIGAPWMDGFKKLPANSRFELEIPLQRENKTNGIEFLKASLVAMGENNLYSIEIGNEPNLYKAPPAVTVQEYVKAEQAYMNSIASAVPSLKQPIFRGLDYSSDDKINGNFSVANAFQAGLNDKKQIKEISLHYYQAHGGDSLANDLLSPNATETRTNRFIPSINFLKKNYPSIPLILGEVGDIIGKQNNQKDLTLSASLGAAVWTANWMLYCMTIGIDRVETQLAHGSQFSPWQPITNKLQNTQAGVTGPFYGLLMIADLVQSAKQGLKVAQVNTGSDRVTAYSTYDGQKLSGVMLFNTEVWTPGNDKRRPTQSISLRIPDSVKHVAVKRLSGDNSEELINLSWAGQRWEYPSGKPVTVGADSEGLTPKGGMVTITIPATEGVMATFSETDRSVQDD